MVQLALFIGIMVVSVHGQSKHFPTVCPSSTPAPGDGVKLCQTPLPKDENFGKKLVRQNLSPPPLSLSLSYAHTLIHENNYHRLYMYLLA
jgi:hypothetical protein